MALVLAMASVGPSGCLHRRRAPAEADESSEAAPEAVSRPVAPPPDPVDLSRSPVREGEVRGVAEAGELVRVGGDGEIDARAVARIIRGQIGGIAACYERSLRSDPALMGRMSVTFIIGGAGRITSLSTVGLEAAPAVGSCVGGRLRGLVFPVAFGGGAEFTAPFAFEPES
jgi:hypothetical protein